MRLPIGYALHYPQRLREPFGVLDWSRLDRLEFEQPDLDAFVCLRLAYEAGRLGGAAPAWLNAANEVAVSAFLAGTLQWLGIAEVVEDALRAYQPVELDSVEAVLEVDREARRAAELAVQRRCQAA
jgi:1-deoxy-D-xylulose-5-phosphate reductoisomerase